MLAQSTQTQRSISVYGNILKESLKIKYNQFSQCYNISSQYLNSPATGCLYSLWKGGLGFSLPYLPESLSIHG